MKMWRFLLMAVFTAASVCGWAQPSSPKPLPSPQAQQPAAAATPAATAQAPTAQTSDPAVQAVRERAAAYYAAMVKHDRATAAQFVAPESKTDFEHVDLSSLISATVSKVSMEASGEAHVVVDRSFAGPFAMSVPWTDTWKQVDGAWYLVLAKSSGETPFGTVASGSKAAASAPDEQQVKAEIERRSKLVDPDVAFKQINKLESEKRAEEAKAQADQQQKAKDASNSKSTKKKKNSKKNSDKDQKPVSAASAAPTT